MTRSLAKSKLLMVGNGDSWCGFPPLSNYIVKSRVISFSKHFINANNEPSVSNSNTQKAHPKTNYSDYIHLFLKELKL
jgi:hypothetical protein